VQSTIIFVDKCLLKNSKVQRTGILLYLVDI
jgi:hypothetical protein